MPPLAAVVLAITVELASGILYDTYTGRPVGPIRAAELRARRLIPWCAIDIADCKPDERRRLDYTCNNLRYPSRGATATPLYRLLLPQFAANGGLKPAASGRALPNARTLRVALMSDGRIPSRKFTHMMTHILVFVTGDVTSIHDTVNYVLMTRNCCDPGGESDPRCMPITVASNDVHLRRSPVRCLNLTRAITFQRLGCAPDTLPPERLNEAPPMLELSLLYGTNEESARRSRTGSGGLLQSDRLRSGGQEWLPQGGVVCIGNQPPAETRCHNGASSLSNALLGGNLFSLWFFRNHNRLARRLQTLNPCWDDERLFFAARDINIAYYQHMLYYELMVALLGYEFLLRNRVVYDTVGHVDDYDDNQEPRVSIEYVVGSQWFHTVQEGRQKMYTKSGKLYNEIAVVDLILRTGALAINNTIEGVTQGSFRQPAAEYDYVVDPDMGERVLGFLQLASDVVSNDIMKERDAGLPPYNQYRRICGLPLLKTLKDLYNMIPKDQAEAIQMLYDDIEDIELMTGLLAERQMEGAHVGPTLACILVDQLRRWRQADRFWYENSVHPGAFTGDQLLEIRRFSLARLVCDNGDDVDEIQPQAYIVPGPGNEITKCSNIYAPSMEPWRDHSCIGNSTKDSDAIFNSQYYSQYGKVPKNTVIELPAINKNPYSNLQVNIRNNIGVTPIINPNIGPIPINPIETLKNNPYVVETGINKNQNVDLGIRQENNVEYTPSQVLGLNSPYSGFRSILDENVVRTLF